MSEAVLEIESTDQTAPPAETAAPSVNPVNIVARLDIIHEQIEAIEAELLEGESTGEIPGEVFDALCAFTTAEESHVDDTATWLSRIENSIAFLKGEEKFYQTKRKFAENALSAVRDSLRDHLVKKGEENGDSARKLNGRSKNIWAQKNPADSLIIDDPEQIPVEYADVRVGITVPANETDTVDWLRTVLEAKDIEFSVSEPIISEQRIRTALEGDKLVVGAVLKRGYHLRWSKPAKVAAKKKPKEIAGAEK